MKLKINAQIYPNHRNKSFLKRSEYLNSNEYFIIERSAIENNQYPKT